MIIKTAPDKHKASSLFQTAKISFERLKETDMKKYPSNTLKDYYDIIHSLLESLASLEGVKTKQEGAHKELIDYVCQQHKLEESTRIFLQQLREYRNRIFYEGFNVNPNYISLNSVQLQKIVNYLFKLYQDELNKMEKTR